MTTRKKTRGAPARPNASTLPRCTEAECDLKDARIADLEKALRLAVDVLIEVKRPSDRFIVATQLAWLLRLPEGYPDGP